MVSFSIISDISISVNNSNSTTIFLKSDYHANPGADKKWTYISMHLLRKPSNTAGSNNKSP